MAGSKYDLLLLSFRRRVGHDPKEILSQLSGWLNDTVFPNMTISAMGGGIENLNTVPATLVEMLCQSFQGKPVGISRLAFG